MPVKSKIQASTKNRANNLESMTNNCEKSIKLTGGNKLIISLLGILLKEIFVRYRTLLKL